MSVSARPIATVATLTGISKEVLRKWEDRYGFPHPLRDDAGRRLYTDEQIDRLQRIKLMLDRGLRPGQVVPLDDDALAALASASTAGMSGLSGAESPGEAALIACLQTADPRAVRVFFDAQLAVVGLRGLVCDILPSMNWVIGTAWADGRIEMHELHLYTETVRVLLYEQTALIAVPVIGPRVILATASGEAHTLGVQLVHALLVMEGADCISLGAGLDSKQIALAALRFRADIVGLSFSHAFPVRAMDGFLQSLQKQLPAGVILWAGGAVAANLSGRRRGVLVLPRLDDAIAALQAFRKEKRKALGGRLPRSARA